MSETGYFHHERLEPPAEIEPRVRDRLIAAATNLFAHKGYAATSVSEIVAAAGVTKPILYYYFKNKEGLYIEIVRQAYAKLDAFLDECLRSTGPAAERLLSMAERLHDLFIENLDVARMINAIYYGPPQGAPAYDYDAHFLKYLETVRRIASDGLRVGEFRGASAGDVTLGVAAINNMAWERQFSQRGPKMEKKEIKRVMNIFFKGLTGPDAGQGERKS